MEIGSSMRFRLYLRVVGPEKVIQLFGHDADWAHSSIRSLRRDATWPPTDGKDPSWLWQTQSIEATPADLENTVLQFLSRCTPLANHIAKHRGALHSASLVVVGDCDESDVPSGLYFSPDIISSMQELGVGLDIDFVRVDEATTR
jgi:hypothetical protein